METTRPAAPAALQELLTGIIDYAGVFPPARLPLDEAAAKYMAYKSGPEAWIVNRFICPVTQLDELSEDFRLCVTGRGGDSIESWLKNTQEDLDRSSGADIFEVRAPAGALAEGYLPAILLDMAIHARGQEVFIEVPMEETWQNDVPTAIGHLQESGLAKAKIRMGGLTADTFPTSQQVALFITECAQKGVPFKATAGLHHPYRRKDAEIGAVMHGFLNVFCAAVVAVVHGPPMDVLVDMLENNDDFAFSNEGFTWRDMSVSTADVTKARGFARSFGSCSVNEPLEGLKEAGYL